MTQLNAKNCQIEWWENDHGQVRRTIVFERVFDDDGWVIFPPEVDHFGRQKTDCSHGACVINWMAEGCDPRSTPEGVFAGMVRTGFVDAKATLQTVEEFGKLDTCDWARVMGDALRRQLVNEDVIEEGEEI